MDGAFLTGWSQQVKIGSVLSNSVIPRGGIPQGTRQAPLLFAVLVNNLVKDWKTRVKYEDDLSVLQIIPRCSTSMLPFVARDICLYASSHGIKLNSSKCKELRIDLQLKPSYSLSPRFYPPYRCRAVLSSRRHIISCSVFLCRTFCRGIFTATIL